MSHLYKSKFRTLNTPLIPDILEDLSNDSQNDINISLGMGMTILIYLLETNPNIEFDICNFIFCFCFSGPIIYSQNEEILNQEDLSIVKINWIEEEIHSKESFINKKHNISYLFLFFIRIIFLSFLTFLFYYLPNVISLFERIFGFSDLNFDQKLTEAFLFALISTIFTIIYANFSIKYKHFFSVFVLTFFILFVIFAVGLEIINLTEGDSDEIIMLV